jgi:hypothetical protein
MAHRQVDKTAELGYETWESPLLFLLLRIQCTEFG